MNDPHDPTNLDGPIAAPDHHRIVYENGRVRVLETIVRAGDTAPVHTHLTPHLMVMRSGSHFVRRDAAGAVMVDTRAVDPPFEMPGFLWSDGTPAHTLENVGPDDLTLLSIELKPLVDGGDGGSS